MAESNRENLPHNHTLNTHKIRNDGANIPPLQPITKSLQNRASTNVKSGSSSSGTHGARIPPMQPLSNPPTPPSGKKPADNPSAEGGDSGNK